MIGNKYLQTLFQSADEDYGINQLLELLYVRDHEFIASLSREPVDVDSLTEQELEFMIKAASLIDYYLQLRDLDVPRWVRHPELAFKYPYYNQKRLSDFDRIRLIYSVPAPFRNRNVYFDLESINRRRETLLLL